MTTRPLRSCLLLALLSLALLTSACGRRRSKSETVSQLPSPAIEASADATASAADDLTPEPAPEPAPEPRPAPAPAPVVEEPRWVVETTTDRSRCTFALDASRLDETAKNAIATLMSGIDGTDVERIRLEGHCCEIGTEDYNERLGQRRAEAVAFHLHDEHGIPLDRIQRVSFGKRRPVASNDTDTGRQRNRRCEIAVVHRTRRRVP